MTSVSNLANGADQIQRRSKSTQIKHVVAKLQGLGLDVEIKPLAAWLARR